MWLVLNLAALAINETLFIDSVKFARKVYELLLQF